MFEVNTRTPGGCVSLDYVWVIAWLCIGLLNHARGAVLLVKEGVSLFLKHRDKRRRLRRRYQ
jgi:hypothetical protein